MMDKKCIKTKARMLPPPPFMILDRKLKVSQCHSDEGGDNDEDDENDEEDAVYGVNLVPPNTSKYIVELNVDGTERKEPSHRHLRNCPSIPWQLRDLSGILCGAAWSLEFCLAIFTGNPSQDEQRSSD